MKPTLTTGASNNQRKTITGVRNVSQQSHNQLDKGQFLQHSCGSIGSYLAAGANCSSIGNSPLKKAPQPPFNTKQSMMLPLSLMTYQSDSEAPKRTIRLPSKLPKITKQTNTLPLNAKIVQSNTKIMQKQPNLSTQSPSTEQKITTPTLTTLTVEQQAFVNLFSDDNESQRLKKQSSNSIATQNKLQSNLPEAEKDAPLKILIDAKPTNIAEQVQINDEDEDGCVVSEPPSELFFQTRGDVNDVDQSKTDCKNQPHVDKVNNIEEDKDEIQSVPDPSTEIDKTSLAKQQVVIEMDQPTELEKEEQIMKTEKQQLSRQNVTNAISSASSTAGVQKSNLRYATGGAELSSLMITAEDLTQVNFELSKDVQVFVFIYKMYPNL